jgi:WD40 repeat protein
MSIADELQKLKDLHASGALTEDEFARAKALILAATPTPVASPPVPPPSDAPVPTLPSDVPQPRGIFWLLRKMGEHLLETVLTFVAVIVLNTIVGGAAGALGWLPSMTKVDGQPLPEWAVWALYVLLGLGALVCGVAAPINWVRSIHERLHGSSAWLRWPAYIGGAIAGFVFGLAVGAFAGGAFFFMAILIYGLLVAAPLAAGLGITKELLGWSGATFLQGMAIGAIGTTALALLLGVPLTILGLLGMVWDWFLRLIKQFAIGRALLRAGSGAIGGAIVGPLAGWFVHQYAWSHAWAGDDPLMWVLTGIGVGAFVNALAQMPRDAGEQLIVAALGAVLGAIGFMIVHAFDTGGDFGSYAIQAGIGAIIGALIAWSCWQIFAMTIGWFLESGPTVREILRDSQPTEDAQEEIDAIQLELDSVYKAAAEWSRKHNELTRILHEMKVATPIDVNAITSCVRNLEQLVDDQKHLNMRTSELRGRLDALQRPLPPFPWTKLAHRMWPLLPATMLLVALCSTEMSYRSVAILAAPDSPEAFSVACLAFSPDGNQALFGAKDKTIRVWDLNRRVELKRFPCDARSVGFSPDGASAWSVGVDGITIWNLATGARRFVFPGLAAAWTDKNEILSVNQGNWEWRDGADGKPLRVAPATPEMLGNFACSADGKIAVTAHGDHSLRVWDLAAGTHRRLTGPLAATSALTISADGKHAVSVAGGKSFLWDVSAGTWTDVAPDWHVNHAALSQDGRRLALAGATKDVFLRNGRIRFWGTASRQEIYRVRIEGVTPQLVGISPDAGKLLFTGDGAGFLFAKVAR